MQCSLSALLSKELCAALQKMKPARLKSKKKILSPKLSSHNTTCCYRTFYFFSFATMHKIGKLFISAFFLQNCLPFVSFAKLLLRVFNWQPSIDYSLTFFAKLALCYFIIFRRYIRPLSNKGGTKAMIT